MVSNKDINWIYAKIQNRHRNALGVEKTILGEVLGLFEAAPDFQIVLTLNDASEEELRKLMEGVRHECMILPGGSEMSMVEIVEPEQEWIPVTERLPESGVHVLFCCEKRSGGAVYKRYVCDGYYAKRYTEQTWNNSGDIACEYREEDDEYYLLEGWYEIINNWDDYSSIAIADFVTHWMPLPEPPKEEDV